MDRQPAHAPKDKVASAYDRAQFLVERRKMMQERADYLEAVERGDMPQPRHHGSLELVWPAPHH